jgi:uncharacterized protein YciI
MAKRLSVVLVEGPTGTLETLKERYNAVKEEEFGYIRSAYQSGGAVLIGRFSDPTKGALAVFESEEQAEAFIQSDPLVRDGIVGKYQVLELHVLEDVPVPAS